IVAAGVLRDGDHGRLTADDTLAPHVDERGRRAEIDREIVREQPVEPVEDHGSPSRASAAPSAGRTPAGADTARRHDPSGGRAAPRRRAARGPGTGDDRVFLPRATSRGRTVSSRRFSTTYPSTAVAWAAYRDSR